MWIMKNEPRKKKSCSGSRCGWKRRTHFSTGSTCAKRRLISRSVSQRARRRMSEREMPDLHYVMEIEPPDLGADVKAVGLGLMEGESREPAPGKHPGRIL